MDDALTALRWCVEHDEDPARAFRMLAPLWAVVHSTAAAEVTDARRARAGAVGSAPTRGRCACSASPRPATSCSVSRSWRVRGRSRGSRRRRRRRLIARRALALVVYHYGRDLEESDRLLGGVIGLAEQRGATWIAVEMSALRALGARAAARRGRAGARWRRRARARAGGAARTSTRGSPHVLGMIAARLGLACDEARRRARARRSSWRGRSTIPLIVGGSLRHLGVVAALEGDRAGSGAQLVGAAIDHFRTQRRPRAALGGPALGGDRARRGRRSRDRALRLLAGAQASPVARGLAPLERALLARVLGDVERGGGPGRPRDAHAARRPTRSMRRRRRGRRRRPRPSQRSAIFRREGSLWRLAFAGTEVQMPHLKGLADLAALLANPGAGDPLPRPRRRRRALGRPRRGGRRAGA